MSEAVTQILESSAPGQIGDVAAQLARLGVSVDPSLLREVQESKGKKSGGGGGGGVKSGHPLAGPLQQSYLQHFQTAFAGLVRGGIAKEITTRVWTQESSSGANAFDLCGYAEKLDLPNLQTGTWTSKWTLLENGCLKGDVQLHTYAFEDGNTQLQLSKSFESSTVFSSPDAILAQIVSWEHEVLSILRGLQELAPESLKQLRRVLPITKTKMNWAVEAQRGVQNLKQSTSAQKR